MKKIALASAAMGGAALLAFGASGTFAAFQDSSTQTAGAGAGTLTIGVGRPASAPAQAGNLAPGESVVVPLYVKNTGNDISGTLGASIEGIVDQENGCYGPEIAAEDGCQAADDEGEFSAAADYAVALSGASETACNASATPNGWGWIPFQEDDGLLPTASPLSLDPGKGACLLLRITLDEERAGNDVQSDVMSFTAKLTLEQKF
ncbi:TasA family protein [Geodermatophilus sp. SYSU D00696]